MDDNNLACYGTLVLQLHTFEFVDRQTSVELAIGLVKKHQMPVRLVMPDYYIYILENDTVTSVLTRCEKLAKQLEYQAALALQKTVHEMGTDSSSLTN